MAVIFFVVMKISNALKTSVKEVVKVSEGKLNFAVSDKLMKERMVGEFWDKNSTSRDALMEQNKDGKPVEEVEKELLKFLDKNFGKEVYLAGNSIHQDRKFIEREMPELNKRLHYRMLDVSAWKIYFENGLGRKFTKPENHRALDDIEGSIEELKWYLTFLK